MVSGRFLTSASLKKLACVGIPSVSFDVEKATKICHLSMMYFPKEAAKIQMATKGDL